MRRSTLTGGFDLGSHLGLLGGLLITLCLDLLLALQSGHVIVILALLTIVLTLVLLATKAAGAAELGEVDATEVAATFACTAKFCQ